MPPPPHSARPVSEGAAPVRSIEPGRWGVAALWLALIAVIVFLPDGMTRWFLPKDALVAIAAVGASLAPATGRLPRWFVMLVAAGVATLLVTALLSASPVTAIMGRFPRYEGLVSLSAYFGAAWLGARLLGPRSTRTGAMTFSRAAATIALLLGFVALLETIGLRPIASDLDRPGSLVGNATDQGIVGGMLLMLLALPTLRAWRPQLLPARSKSKAPQLVTTGTGDAVLFTAGLLGAGAALVLSASRGALLATAVGIIVVAALVILDNRSTARSPWWKPAAAGTAALALLSAVALLAPLTRSRLTGSSALSSSTINDRMLIWQETVSMLGATALAGVGPSGYADAIARSHTPEWFSTVGASTTLDSPHNVLLQAWSAGGAVFVLLTLALIVWVSIVGVRAVLALAGRVPTKRGSEAGVSRPPVAQHSLARSDLLIGSLAACAVWAAALLTHFTAASTSILGCSIVGVIVASAPGSDPRRWWPPLRTTLIAVWALWFMAVAFAEVPLQRGVAASARGDVATAQAQFQSASVIRPWDADVQAIAAQSLAAAADGGVTGAADVSTRWAERALEVIPDHVPTLKAYAVALQTSGDLATADVVIADLLAMRPYDADVHLRWAIHAYLSADLDAAAERAAHAQSLAPADESIATFVTFLETAPR